MMTAENEQIDVIIRTKNSQEYLQLCLDSVLEEIPVRKIIVVDGGSTDETIPIVSKYACTEIFVRPDLNLGQATKFAFSKSQTEWVAVIDSDVILQKGWFEDMKEHMFGADAVEGCRIDHYSFTIRADTTKSYYGRFGQTLLKRDPVLQIDLDTPFGEDALTKAHFEIEGRKWKKVPNFLADHYTKIIKSKHSRTSLLYRAEPQVIWIPKSVQIIQGHLARKCHALTPKQVVRNLLLPPIYEAYWAFKKSFWFTLAFFKLI